MIAKRYQRYLMDFGEIRELFGRFAYKIPQNSYILFVKQARTDGSGRSFENESDVRRESVWFTKRLVNLGLSVYNYRRILEKMLAISLERITRF